MTNPKLEAFLRAMPKVELHVHLEGSIQPETILTLAKRHGVTLPANTVEGLRAWYRFTNFDHFVEIYLLISSCLKTVDDVELIAREFLAGQAAQNIRHTEFTYSASTHYFRSGWPFADQLAALNRARHWAEKEFGISSGIVVDIVRNVTPEQGVMVAEWAISGKGNGVVALGLGGKEVGNPPEKFRDAFALTRAAGLPNVPHAGETLGVDAKNIWTCIHDYNSSRIGHGFRCLLDPELMKELARRQVALEICPSSNVCMGETPSMAEHPLPKLMREGVIVTINSDDPPMFNTTLTGEYLAVADAFGFGEDDFVRFVLNAAEASLIPEAEKSKLVADINSQCATLRAV